MDQTSISNLHRGTTNQFSEPSGVSALLIRAGLARKPLIYEASLQIDPAHDCESLRHLARAHRVCYPDLKSRTAFHVLQWALERVRGNGDAQDQEWFKLIVNSVRLRHDEHYVAVIDPRTAGYAGWALYGSVGKAAYHKLKDALGTVKDFYDTEQFLKLLSATAHPFESEIDRHILLHGDRHPHDPFATWSAAEAMQYARSMGF